MYISPINTYYSKNICGTKQKNEVSQQNTTAFKGSHTTNSKKIIRGALIGTYTFGILGMLANTHINDLPFVTGLGTIIGTILGWTRTD